MLFNIGLDIAFEYLSGIFPLLATLYIVLALTLILPLLFLYNYFYTSLAVAFLLTKVSFTHFASLLESILGLPTRPRDLGLGRGETQLYNVLLASFIILHTSATVMPSASCYRANCLI